MVDLGGKAKDFLNSDQGEKVSDGALDKAAGAADKATGGGHEDQLDKARDAADSKLGDQ